MNGMPAGALRCGAAATGRATIAAGGAAVMTGAAGAESTKRVGGFGVVALVLRTQR